MMLWKPAVWLLVTLGALAAAAAAQERILNYHSDITVHKDGWLTVTETIQVRATGKEIKRGIYRDFPVRYVGRHRSRVIVPCRIVRVERNGRPEAYHTENRPPFKRIYIGRKNVLLRPGVYTYKLTYRTNRQLGFFKDHDELYWNVTGNEWAFRIERASATVTLPAGAAAAKVGHEAYTGPEGAKGQNYRSFLDSLGRAVFQTTGPLNREEGLTIVVTWPKGFVTEPTADEKLWYFLLDNGRVAVALIGLVAVTVYFTVAWSQVGCDPAKGLIIPLFDPPDNLSPAAMRYILKMGYDKTCFAATLISLAVKKYLTIEDDDGDYSLVRNDGADEAGLSPGEAKVARRLLGRSRKTIELDSTKHATFRGAADKLKKALAGQYDRRYFFTNRRHLIAGVAMSVLTLLGVAVVGMLVDDHPAVGFMALWLGGWSIGVFFLVRQVIVMWKAVRAGRANKIKAAVGMTLFAVPFVAAEVFVLTMLVSMTSIWLLPVLLALGLVNVRFAHLLKRPTVTGRQVMDRIEGFQMYLATTGDGAQALPQLVGGSRRPKRTIELFEAYLPYALALDVENAWAEKFADVLAAAGKDGYEPGWYHGTAWATVGAVGFASSLGSSFSGALSAASASPGSTSGSGGGGSSGGGGGGGGGGGW
ncbi:MAG: DUF2207 domain-containing protein [Planctomycetota bacterium]|nr:DUF2207 domain-containing protein [Planctomycetota bacterium]